MLKSQGKEKEKGKKGKKGQTKLGPGSEPRTKRPPPTKKKEENPDAEGLVIFFISVWQLSRAPFTKCVRIC
jgi:hypothetical protein